MKSFLQALIIAMILLAGALAQAAETRVYIDMEGFLTQGVPPRNRGLFPAGDLIAIPDGRTFIKLPGAELFLDKAFEAFPEAKFYAMGPSYRSADDNKALLKQMKLSDGRAALDRFSEVLGHSFDAIQKASHPAGTTVFIVSTRTINQKGLPNALVINPGPGYYHYPDYQTVEKEIARLKAENSFSGNIRQYFPDDEQQWEMHLQNRGRAFKQLSELLPLTPAQAQDRVMRIVRLDLNDAQAGTKMLTTWRMPDRWRWELEKKADGTFVIKHCLFISGADKTTKAVGNSECADKIPGKHVWDGQGKNRCLLLTDENAEVGPAAAAKCADIHWLRYKGARPNFFVKDDGKIGGMSDDDLRKRYQRESSFRQLISEGKFSSRVYSGTNCTAALKEVFARGGDLSSPILKSRIVPLRSIKLASGTHDDTFYHYTNFTGFTELFETKRLPQDQIDQKAAEENRFDKMMGALRAVNPKGIANLWGAVLYVAEDPSSSASYGTYGFEFRLDLNAPTITYDKDLWESAVNEVLERHPGLKKECGLVTESFSAQYFYVYMPRIFFIVAEESGAQIVDYQQGRWFQILSPELFRSIKQTR